MKKLIVIAAAMIALNAADATAQSFMKKVGKAVEKEAAKEVVSQINKGIANQSNKEKESKAQPKKSQQTQTKQTQTKQTQAKQSQTQKAPQNSTSATTKSSGQKKYVKNIELYYKIGRVEGNYKLFYDSQTFFSYCSICFLHSDQLIITILLPFCCNFTAPLHFVFFRNTSFGINK